VTQRIFELFHRELKGVREAAFLLAAATIASNILGLFRDRLLASRFGAGVELDIYYAAFRIPDILYTFSLFFVASTAIIPLFLERYSESDGRAYVFVQTVFIAFFVSISGLVAIVFFIMPHIISLLVPGFDITMQQDVIYISRILLISPILLGFSNLISSILQSFRRFFVYAASFLFYNIGIIVGILFFVPRWGLHGLAWGVVLGALLHVGIQIPSFLNAGYVPRFVVGKMSDLRDVFYRSFPRTLGLAATQISFLVITAIASTLGVGSIAVFQLSFNLQSIPLAIIGLSYSVAAFPTMAELIIKKERIIFFEHLLSASRHIVFWTVPITVLFIILRAQIVRVVFGAGSFGWLDTRLTAASLALFSIGIVAQSLIVLFVRAFYAIGNTRVPVIVNLFSMAITIILAFFFVQILQETESLHTIFSRLLRVEDVSQIAVLGLPLAFSLGAIINAVMLGLRLGWTNGEFHPRKLGASAVDIMSASVLLGIVSYIVLQILGPLFNLNRFWGIFLQGLFAGVAGILVAVIYLHLRNNKEFIEVRAVLGRKFWRKETIGPEQEHL
jgi:putative peptidoglycan lipid II flippase